MSSRINVMSKFVDCISDFYFGCHWVKYFNGNSGNDSNLMIVFYVQSFHRFSSRLQ